MSGYYERRGELLGEQSYDEPADGWPDSAADLGETDDCCLCGDAECPVHERMAVV